MALIAAHLNALGGGGGRKINKRQIVGSSVQQAFPKESNPTGVCVRHTNIPIWMTACATSTQCDTKQTVKCYCTDK